MASRIGSAKEGKDRLLKIELDSVGDRKTILSKAKKLRDSSHDVYKKAYIRPDLTKNQMAESKNLRASLKVIRESQPEKKWTIKRGQIIEIK